MKLNTDSLLSIVLCQVLKNWYLIWSTEYDQIIFKVQLSQTFHVAPGFLNIISSPLKWLLEVRVSFYWRTELLLLTYCLHRIYVCDPRNGFQCELYGCADLTLSLGIQQQRTKWISRKSLQSPSPALGHSWTGKVTVPVIGRQFWVFHISG